MSGFPLRMGSEAAFRTVREFLAGAGFTEEFLLRHFQVPQIHLLLVPFGMHGSYLASKYQGEGLPLFLARTLVAGFDATPAEVRRYWPDPVRDSLLELGIFEPHGENLRSTVMVLPGFGFIVAADRGVRPGGLVYQEQDFVMCGAENLSRRYVDTFGKSPCESLLELGTGAGLGALVASRFAAKVTATDIVPRAVSYAEFNCRLNGVTNVEVLQGDLFAPVAGRTFDRIVCHPPFEPSIKGDYTFSIGGEDGEAVIERIVREAPAHLNPGGRLYCQVTGTDRQGEPFEERVRTWLGDDAARTDVALFVRLTTEPREYAVEQILAENQDSWKLLEWNVMYSKIKARLVIVGMLVLQKRASERPVFFTRRVFGPRTGLAEMEDLLAWETRAAEPGFAEDLMGLRPVPGEGWKLYARHAMREGKLATLGYTFFNEYPFETNLHSMPWMPVVVSQCDGKKTAGELFMALRGRLRIDPNDYVQALAALLGMRVLKFTK
ncbi:MAG: methyltransferase [Bryobacterales bacterium]|nr:methyltransferase [Bryobacterales bacterium]